MFGIIFQRAWLGCRCPGFGSGWGCRVATVRRGQGCPGPDMAGSSLFQLAPTDPPQGTAEHRSQDGALGKAYL